MNDSKMDEEGKAREELAMAERKDAELLAMLLELGGTVAGLAREAMVGSLDQDGFALRELGQIGESCFLISRAQILLNEVEIPPRWREIIVNLLDAVECIQSPVREGG